MSTTISAHPRVLALGATAALALGLVGGPAAAMDTVAAPTGSAAGTGPKACRVTLAGTAYTSLAAAEAAATDGATIRVRGTCIGTTIIDTDLTIVGVQTSTSGPATLSGDDAGVILVVRAGTELILRDLAIRDGRNGYSGGAIVARGSTITMHDTTVSGNRAARGGAVWMEESTLNLRGASRLKGNRAVNNEGGAVYARMSLIRMYDTSQMYRNIARGDDGGAFSLCGSDLQMFDTSRLHHNAAIDDDAGAVDTSSCDGNGSSVTMNDDSRMDHNHAFYDDGGAIYACEATVTLNDRASIDHNTAEDGGGIAMRCGTSSVTTNDSSRIVNNTAGRGGGISACVTSGSLELHDTSRIAGNTAINHGGGVGVDECNGLDIDLSESASIRGNTAELNGAGIYGNVSVTMGDSSRITGNDAGQIAGGIYIMSGELVMDGEAQIAGNIHAAAENGAGVSSCGQTFSGVTELTNVLDNLAPNGPIGDPAATQVWDRCS